MKNSGVLILLAPNLAPGLVIHGQNLVFTVKTKIVIKIRYLNPNVLTLQEMTQKVIDIKMVVPVGLEPTTRRL